ncbi:MAG: TAXI family TRAP transporter solute-binding subunit [Desulfovibrio sp.]|jgi:TRAP transporter TAXI family solute receptor|nr:TAXI family TRAP transporter solute-binding subunit [Desulfovibrio sp.]
MKRFFYLACALITAIMAVAPERASSAERVNFATGGTTGIYYTLGGVIAQTLKDKGLMEITVQSTGASNENLRLVNQGEVPIAFSQNDLAYAAFNGLTPYKAKYENITAIAATHAELIHAVARKGAGISKIEEFRGHRISLGARGSGNEANCRQIFPFFKLTYDDLTPIFLPYGESIDQFKDRQIDGFLFTFPYPHPIMMDITTTHEVEYLPIAGKQADEIIAQYPYFFKADIPAGTYKGQNAAVPTIGVKAMLIADKNTPEDVVYTFTKGLFENLEDIRKGHSKAEEISLKTALEAVTIPLHPGAAKYYREVGLLK